MDKTLLQKLVDQYIQAFATADIRLIQAMFADDALVEDPVGTPVRSGIADITAFYEGAFASGAKLVLHGKPRCAGNTVAFSFDVVLNGMTISPIDVFEVNAAGKIQSMKAYWGEDNVT